jgi:hypothetical protein
MGIRNPVARQCLAYVDWSGYGWRITLRFSILRGFILIKPLALRERVAKA